MIEQKNNCTALILHPETVERRKRAELELALENGEIHDPFTAVAVGSIVAGSIFGGRYAHGLVGALLSPKPKPQVIEKGRQTGQLIISSELGQIWPEIYGGDPGDGYGGSWVAAIILWAPGLVPHKNVSRQEVGGGKGPPTQVQETVEITYSMDIALGWGLGPLRLLREKANNDVIYDLYGQVSNYEGESGTFAGTTSIEDFESASNGKEVTLGPNGSVQWSTVQSNGAATRQASLYYRTSVGVTITIEWTTNGVMQSITLPTTNEAYRTHTIPLALNDGVNTIKIKNVSPTFNLGIDRIYCFPGHTADTAGTGVFDPDASPDADYDHELPPDPIPSYNGSVARFRGEVIIDEYGVGTGTLLHGGNASIAIYPGNDIQLPDPTMQAALDAQYGADSTPAYRGRCYEVNTNFYLTRWQNAFPNRIGLLEHLFIKKQSQLSAHMAGRVNIDAADYNFTLLDYALRGLRITGRRFQPREPLEQCAQWFNTYYAEEEGVLWGRPRGSVVVDVITDADLGWSENDTVEDGPLNLLDISEPAESSIPRIFDVKYQNLDREGEPGLETDVRQIIDSEERQSLEVEITATPDEARAVAQRELYQADTEKPVKFNLSWEYLWLNVGNILPITLADGYSYEIEITKISGGIGVLECEGLLIDTPIFTQPVNTDPSVFEVPPVPIPVMTICFLMDTPLLRDVDATVNNGAGFYACATPITNDGLAWSGASLYVSKIGWERVADFTLPATMGRATTVLADVSNPSVLDTVSTVTVDLYGTNQTLSSATTDDLYAGANAALLGNEVIQFATATRVEESPNRWTLSNFLRARRRTIHQTSTHVVNERFALLNEAVQFVPINVSEVGAEREYKPVSAAQSLDDAPTITFAWLGGSLKTFAPDALRGTRQSNNDWRFTCQRAARFGQGMRPYSDVPLGEERLIFDWTIMDGSDEIRTTRIYDTSVQAATLLDRSAVSDVGVITNIAHITEQRLDLEDSYVMADFTLDVAESLSVGLVDNNGAGMISDGSGGIVFNQGWLVSAGFTGDDLFGIFELGVLVHSETLPAATGATLRLEIKNSVLRYYLDYENSSSLPIYTSTRTDLAGRDLRGYFFRTSGITFSQQRVKVGQPTYIYPEAQQIDDFGSAQSPITIRVRQVSTIVGPGDYAEGEFSG